MRNILGDLEERASIVSQEIDDENRRFERLMLRVKREQQDRIEELKGQLYAVRRLIQVATWQHDVRAVLKLSTAVVGAVEGSVASTIRQFCHPEL
jgi:hypothetical protein